MNTIISGAISPTGEITSNHTKNVHSATYHYGPESSIEELATISKDTPGNASDNTLPVHVSSMAPGQENLITDRITLLELSKNSPVVVKDTNLQISMTDNNTPMTPIAAHKMIANYAIQPSSSPFKRRADH